MTINRMEPTHSRIQLIAVDLDGTLIGKDLTIPVHNRRALQAAMKAGCWATIATGRSFIPTVRYAHELELNAPLLLYQGALIQDHWTGRIIHRETLPLPLAREVAALAADHELVTQVHDEDGTAFTDRCNPIRPLMQTITGIPTTPVDDLVTWLHRPPLKFLFLAQPDQVESLLQMLRVHFDGRVEVVRSHAHIVEITAPGVSKGHGLSVLASHLGVAREATLAIGDHDNDADMLAWAGLGIAMHNASPAALAAADRVAPPQIPGLTRENAPLARTGDYRGDGAVPPTEPHDEAVAWAVERYVLGATA